MPTRAAGFRPFREQDRRPSRLVLAYGKRAPCPASGDYRGGALIRIEALLERQHGTSRCNARLNYSASWRSIGRPRSCLCSCVSSMCRDRRARLFEQRRDDPREPVVELGVLEPTFPFVIAV